MKSKLKFSLVLFTSLYGVFKILQFSVYLVRILNVIVNEDCDEPCVVEYFEMAFIACMFLPICLLLYGALKVKQVLRQDSSHNWQCFLSDNSWNNLSLVCGLLPTQSFLPSTASSNMRYDSAPTAVSTRPKLLITSLWNLVSSFLVQSPQDFNQFFLPVFDSIAFFVICRLNIFLIDHKFQKSSLECGKSTEDGISEKTNCTENENKY